MVLDPFGPNKVPTECSPLVGRPVDGTEHGTTRPRWALCFSPPPAQFPVALAEVVRTQFARQSRCSKDCVPSSSEHR
jgi:hypothetical protein